MNYPKNNIAPRFVFDKESFDELQSEIDLLDAEFKVREIEVTFTGEKYFFGDVTSSNSAYNFIRDIILKGIEVQEHFVAIYLDRANKIIGYYHHSIGTINSTQVDIEIIAAVALKGLAKGVIISHNHPSGNLKPSESDKVLTRKIKDALKLFDIKLIDHLIITKNSFYSFADEGEPELNGFNDVHSHLEEQLREEVLNSLKQVTQANSPTLFSIMQTKQGYLQVEEMVIKKVLHDQMIPSAVIPLLESEYDLM